MDTHPHNPPMVYVKPTSNMQIKSGRNVDMNGKVDLPYLREWRYVSLLIDCMVLKGSYLDFLHLAELKKMYITEIYM